MRLTYAPGLYAWRQQEFRVRFLNALAERMCARPQASADNREWVREAQKALRSKASDVAHIGELLIHYAYYHVVLGLTEDEIREVEYPWRWADVGGALDDANDVRLAFEAMLDIGHYEAAYRFMQEQRYHGRVRR